MEFLSDLGSFTLKTLLITGALLVIIGFLFHLASRARKHGPRLEVEKLNLRYRAFRDHLESHLLGKKDYKRHLKEEKKIDKAEDGARPGRVFVLDFDGDIRASQVASLREEITAVLSVAKPDDEIVLRLESGGGMVTSYGLAASQLSRIRAKNIKLTICVDKIAASGGYMMACVADRILAAPFAVVGSIGVIAQVPNFHRVLKKHDVDFREVTAGQFKRTVTVFGEITEPGMAKFREQIEETHRLFKSFVHRYRPNLNLERVATGEHWYALEASNFGLVDEIMTSDEYLYARSQTSDLFRVQHQDQKKLFDRLADAASLTIRAVFTRLWSDAERTRFGA